MKADIVLKKELLKGNPGGYYVPGVDDDYNLSFTPSQDDMPQVEAVNIKSITLESFLKTNEYQSILDAEAVRKSAEQSRVTAESNRANAEANRVSAEQYRVATEHQRAIDEAERASAELGRKQAEQARETTFNAHMQDWESDVEIAVNDAIANEANRAETFTDAMTEWGNAVESTIDNANTDVATAVAEAEAATQAATEAVNTLLNNAHAAAIVPEITADNVAIDDAAASFAIGATTHITAKQEGTGDASPTNIRAISGWDAASITRVGKNMMPYPYTQNANQEANGGKIVVNADGSITFSGYATGYIGITTYNSVIDGKLKGTYTIGLVGNVNNISTNVTVFDKDGNQLFVNDRVTPTVINFDEYPTAYRLSVLHKRAGNNMTLSGTGYPVIVKGDTLPSEYTPYVEPQTLTAALPETVYGGKLDWNTGVLTVDRQLYVLDGVNRKFNSVNAVNGYSYAHYIAEKPIGTKSGKSVISSHLKPELKREYGYIYVAGDAPITGVFCFIKPFADIGAANAWLAEQNAAGTPFQILISLATPYTIQLTPQQLEMLKGYNNVWSESGNTTIAYIADTKLYIDNKFAALQNAIVSLGSNV